MDFKEYEKRANNSVREMYKIWYKFMYQKTTDCIKLENSWWVTFLNIDRYLPECLDFVKLKNVLQHMGESKIKLHIKTLITLSNVECKFQNRFNVLIAAVSKSIDKFREHENDCQKFADRELPFLRTPDLLKLSAMPLLLSFQGDFYLIKGAICNYIDRMLKQLGISRKILRSTALPATNDNDDKVDTDILSAKISGVRI